LDKKYCKKPFKHLKGPKYEIYHEKDLGGLLLQFALVCFWVRMKAKMK
jgi:hypothetical protein